VSDEPEATGGQVQEVREDIVEVRLPADSAYVSLLRTVTAGLAARLDFTLDEIDDLRIAVDEACALLLPDASSEDELVCRYCLGATSLDIKVSAPTTSDALPSKSSFAWTVLTALAGDVSLESQDHQVSIGLRKTRSERL
jgi:serine/threonine-protein kinase RsbW